jgi:hypothetical protein
LKGGLIPPFFCLKPVKKKEEMKMEITKTVHTGGFGELSDEEKATAFDEFTEKMDKLRFNTDMITVLDGKVWIVANEYDYGELTATFLLPTEY